MEVLTPQQKQAIRYLYKSNGLVFGDFVLNSGESSSYYIDWTNAISDYNSRIGLSRICARDVKRLNLQFAHVIGVRESATDFSTSLANELKASKLYTRVKSKTYGNNSSDKPKLILGKYQEGDTALLFENTITTGKSSVEEAKVLEDQGLKVNDIYCLFDREEGALDFMRSRGYNVHVLLSKSPVFRYLDRNRSIGVIPEDKEIIGNHLKQAA
jgi:orotate phosphoribosyltransferase